MKYILILIYSTVIITAEPRDKIKDCLKEAKAKIGQEYKTVYNTNTETTDEFGVPIKNVLVNVPPKVLMAFCVKGSAIE